ncbi:glycosyltransferase family 2 protein [Salipiger mangrovisoli]|uniref:Glycosyltransferase family 2 protein n=1 Tax=Salipiger mangrovisoli TaxID=2865933 RepID=A0ABR9XA13_9RHOB|nr:glycosyltransferase family 2 protein [Salipiger mangrovisoli]MBE9640450.1 glycosyltransferase family 2 protein [Salipiger mangrovisoli]
MPEAAIIIPHYNDLARLMRCLRALVPQLGAAGLPGTELVVVDNASTEDLAPLSAVFPSVRLVRETRPGAAAARNRGVAETSAPRLFFLDCDCVPDAGWLASAHALAGSGDVVGGAITLFDETPAPRSGAEAFETVFAFDNRRYIEMAGFSVTANLLTRRDVFETTGPFVPGLSEDLDWCRRAVIAGYRLHYADGLRVAHPSRGDWPALRRKWRRLTDESFALNGGSPAARLRWAGKGLLMPLSVLAHAPRVLRHPALRDGSERRAALATLARLRLLRMVWMLGQGGRGHG